MNYRKDEYFRAHNPFPRQPDVAMRLGVCAVARVSRSVNTIQVDTLARKIKVLKSGVRRISY